VIFYADQITDSMRRAIDETNRRRTLQLAYNEEHGITPRGIVKSLDEVRLSTSVVDARGTSGEDLLVDPGSGSGDEMIATLEVEMLREAKALNFEKAASLRDRIEEVRLQVVLEREERERGRGGRRRKGGR
jgi:excinuclease ABC subunit B